MLLLFNPTNPNAETLSGELQAASRTFGLQLNVFHASADGDFDMVFASLLKLHAGALVIGSDPFFNSRSEQLAALAIRHAVPTIYQYRAFAAAGGLMSYGGSFTEPFRQIGVYTGRILKGEKPADLPCRAIREGRTDHQSQNCQGARPRPCPPSVLARADEVIE